MKFKGLIMFALAAAVAPMAAQGAVRKSKVTPQELTRQAQEAFYDYNPSLAMEKIAALKKEKKGVDPDSLALLEQKVERMSEMIQRVEDIVLVDSLTLGRDDFFRHYRLSAMAGTLSSPQQAGVRADSTIVFAPQDNSYMMWGGPEGLMQSYRLTDGTFEPATEVSTDNLNFGGRANYPFMLSDGITLYYATEGEDSLGGLDIYLSRSDRGEYSMPQNMGMPYNSPYDDYMLVIDEETGAGWFATDRNQLGDLITVYVFIPNEIRKNIDVSNPDLAARARIASVAACQPADDDAAAALKQRIARISPATESRVDDTPEFTFALPNGKVYTQWEDFTSAAARRSMETLVDAQTELDSDLQRLEYLRRTYRASDEAATKAILQLEKKVKASRATLKRLANQVVTAEVK